MTWTYIAGFFDGEGSITNNGSGYRITIPQTNLTVLEDIKNYTKIGNIIAVAKRKEHWRDAWVYYISKQTDVENFIKHCYPFLIVKCPIAKIALKKIQKIIKRQSVRSEITINHKFMVNKLRNSGLTWREIGKQLNIDWGYARRLYLKINK